MTIELTQSEQERLARILSWVLEATQTDHQVQALLERVIEQLNPQEAVGVDDVTL